MAKTAGGKVGTAYFKALRDAAPELMKIATAKEARPPELDKVRGGVLDRWRKRAKAADEETLVLLKGFPGILILRRRRRNSSVLKVEEKFHKDFDGVDFT